MERTSLIKEFVPYFADYRKGDREIYNRFFKPDVIPNFTYTRLVSDLPEEAEIVDQYNKKALIIHKRNATEKKKKQNTIWSRMREGEWY